MKRLIALLLCVLMVLPIFGTAYAQSNDSITVTVDGTDCIFAFKKAKVTGTQIEAMYECRNPRGEILYQMTLYFGKHDGEGTYSNTASVSLIDYSQNGYNNSVFNAHPKSSVRKSIGSSELKILSRSSDWMTYTCSLKANVVSNSGKYTHTIEIDSFTFTLGD